MAAYDDLNVKGIFIAGVISVVVVAVTALAVQVVSYSMLQIQMEAKAASSSYATQNEVISSQQEQISAYGVNPDSGNITIPIDEAIKLVAQEGEEKGKDESDANANEI